MVPLPAARLFREQAEAQARRDGGTFAPASAVHRDLPSQRPRWSGQPMRTLLFGFMALLAAMPLDANPHSQGESQWPGFRKPLALISKVTAGDIDGRHPSRCEMRLVRRRGARFGRGSG